MTAVDPSTLRLRGALELEHITGMELLHVNLGTLQVNFVLNGHFGLPLRQCDRSWCDDVDRLLCAGNLYGVP